MFDQFRKLMEQTNGKNCVFCFEKDREIKQRMVKVAKPFYQAAR